MMLRETILLCFQLLTAPWRLVQREVEDIQARREFYAWVPDRGKMWGKGEQP